MDIVDDLEEIPVTQPVFAWRTGKLSFTNVLTFFVLLQMLADEARDLEGLDS